MSNCERSQQTTPSSSGQLESFTNYGLETAAQAQSIPLLNVLHFIIVVLKFSAAIFFQESGGTMKISVLSRSGKEIIKGGVELSDDATVEDLQNAVHSYNKKWYPERQRFTLAAKAGERPQVLQAGKKLSCYFEQSTGQVTFKDLGPQIGYAIVFFWEYFGPLAIYPLFYFFPKVFYSAYGGREKTHPAQTYALAYWSFHYAKRIFETLFIHRFSHGTMPILNLFKNCGYYWSFAAFVSFFLNHPLYTPVGETQMAVGFAIAMVNQLCNLYCHIILRNLRPPGAKGYEIPKGFLFNFITCANYTTEIYAWLGFNIATQTLAGYIFMTVGALQMSLWALAKHKRLRKIFDGKDGKPKYPRRWVMLPPFF